MRKLSLVYMLVIKDLTTQEMYVHTSGRSQTPFATFNIGSAKAAQTKILKNNETKECSIVTVDIKNNSDLLELKLFSV